MFNKESPRAAVVRSSACNVNEKHCVIQEVSLAVRKIKCEKALRPDAVPVEAWKALGNVLITWLIELSN